jgi:hypothetical protein
MKRTKAEVLRVLRHAGLPQVAEELEPELPDVVDFDRDHALFERYELDAEELMNRLGASP